MTARREPFPGAGWPAEKAGRAAQLRADFPGLAAPVSAEAESRASRLAANLKQRLRSSDLPRPAVEADYLLGESRKRNRPLLERIRILGLLASVLDHFFSEQAPAVEESDRQQITARLNPILQHALTDLHALLLPELAQAYAIEIRRPHHLSQEQRDHVRRFFRQRLYPMLTPLAVDPGHPFPFISSHSINLLVSLSRPDSGTGPLSYARIKVPRLMSRFVSVPSSRGIQLLIWSEDAVAAFIEELFPGMEIASVYVFRVLRAVSRARTRDELDAQGRGLRLRQLSSPVARLEVESSMPGEVEEWLASHLALPPALCFRSKGPLALFQLVDLANLAQAAAD